MGRGDQHLEVAVSYLLSEGESELVWDVRIRSGNGTTWRLVEVDSLDLAMPLCDVPGLALTCGLLERWLSGVGFQLSLFP